MVSTLLAAASNTFWSMSQSAASSMLGWPVISLMWSLPRPRRPMVATRMVSFGLPNTVVEAAAAAAVVRKKLRRSISFVTAIRRLLYHVSGISAQSLPHGRGSDWRIASRYEAHGCNPSRDREGALKHTRRRHPSSPYSWIFIAGSGPSTATAAAKLRPASREVTLQTPGGVAPAPPG